ncbi:hypothetical protein, partial [Vibrio parahaemolyticus]|uniref:hypothetical protein n=1 Tax=Vibrio parahaemolyticus TaxID=670 RepID=UPI001C5ED4CA
CTLKYKNHYESMKYMSKIENERKTVLTQLLLVFLLTTFQSFTLRQQQRITINKQNKNINHITHQV